MKINKKQFLILFLLSAFTTVLAQNNAKFVWKDTEGSGRQQKVLFRKNIILQENTSKVEFHIFADSRYHLYVNDTHINFGPSRFYTKNPQFDTYNLSSYFKKGKNTIAVEVLANGMETFQLPNSIGGFIAWGTIVDSLENKTVIKTPGDWKMLAVASMDTQAVKFSFAAGALENQDFRKEPSGWKQPDFNDKNWKQPVLIANQQHWGTLTPREIPDLTQKEKIPVICLGIFNEQTSEIRNSFYVKSADEVKKQYNKGEYMLGYTYIYSPKEQEIELGTWWGKYYLNGGNPIPVSSKSETNQVRENRLFKLQKGWNYLFVEYRAIWGAWEFIISQPLNSNLIFSANKNKEGTVFFKTIKASIKEETETYSNSFKLNDAKLKQQKWKFHSSSKVMRNPARELAWNEPDISKNLITNQQQIGNFKTNKPRFYVFDMGNKTLGRLFIDIDAPKGTTVELGWSEDLNKNQLPFLYKREQINSAARFITNGTDTRYSTFKPYGVRYIIAKVTPSENKEVQLHKIGVIEQVYPYHKTGSFECSDTMFNKIWELGWRTLQVCSEDSYTDTPFRERGLYAGDALPEYAITLVTSGDSRLMKKSLLLFQDMYREELQTGKENKHNDFILKTLIELFWYYKYTGDAEFVKKLYPNYKTYLNHLEKKKTALGYYKSEKVFLEWTKINKRASLTAYQSLLVGSFKMMQELAEDFGYKNDASEFLSKANSLKKVVNSYFWDSEKQLFFDGFDNGKKINSFFPISSTYPLLFDLVETKEKKQQIIIFLDKELLDIGEVSRERKITPYSSFYLFAGLYQNNEAALAERFMKQYWSRMIQQGNDTSWENFDIEGKGTASHAWSGHPTYFLSTEVLGVKVGFNQQFSRDTVLIQPQTETITWAKGTVPHPAGSIKIDWEIKGEQLIFNLELPKNVPYLVQPKGRLANFELVLNVNNY